MKPSETMHSVLDRDRFKNLHKQNAAVDSSGLHRRYCRKLEVLGKDEIIYPLSIIPYPELSIFFNVSIKMDS